MRTVSTRAEAERHIRLVGRRCRGPLEPDALDEVRRLLSEGRLETAVQVDRIGRRGCGYDVNDLICAGPLDGQSRTVPCPTCGNTITYTSARYELSE